MAGPVPDTLDGAKRIGRKFTGGNPERMKYGAPTQLWDCGGGRPAGSICMVFECVDGWILVAYCNDSGGCTKFYEVPCPDNG